MASNDRTKWRSRNSTSLAAWENYLTSGQNLATTGSIADSGVKDRSYTQDTGLGVNRARRKMAEQASKEAGVKGKPGSSSYVTVDKDQLGILTSLFEARLNDIQSRRARPGMSQVGL